ncbi:MAG: tol-pal system protein YbgF [Desulfomonilaceae bacterium]|nr:tol-pal system protein YbgF [Desulfomonilaceae bacterium]
MAARTQEANRHMQAIRMGVIGILCAAAALSIGGCLSRQGAGPSLPYVKPANSVEGNDPVSIRIASRMQEMETELQRLWDSVERLKAAGGDEAEIGALRDRISFIERQLGIDPLAQAPGPSIPPQASSEPPTPHAVAPHAVPPTAPADQQVAQRLPAGQPPLEIRNPPMGTDEQEYRYAYAAFRRGDLDNGIRLFEAFLNSHPKSTLAADATYWIGEAHFAQGHFDEAVLQFDRVLKEYPGSKKELSALLKQGESFEKMGDPRSAAIIFGKLVADHPHTAQARIAARKLKSLPQNPPDQT